MRLALGLEVQIFMPYTSLDGMAILSPYGQPDFCHLVDDCADSICCTPPVGIHPIPSDGIG
jgi:hypothetical protein